MTAWSWIRSGWVAKTVILLLAMTFILNRPPVRAMNLLATPVGTETNLLVIVRIFTEELLGPRDTESMGAIRILIGFGMNALQVTSFRATTCTTSLPSGRNTSISVTHAVTGTIPLITVKLFIGEDGEIVVKKQK
ncbi:MAG: hypothetical protein RIE23_01105 [Pontimonas sp.]